MTITTCIFDFFGTLVPLSLMDEYYGKLRLTARAIGADEEAFMTGWRDTYAERNDGRLPTVEANVMEIARRLDVETNERVVTENLVEFREVMRKTMVPKPESEEVLATIRERRYRLGMISNCNPDVPSMFEANPLKPYMEEIIFSSDVGLRKPDPAIYLEMTRRLGVVPSECLYIGDGHDRELAGASRFGMTTVLVDDHVQGSFIWNRDEATDSTVDHSIKDLREILPILDQLGAAAAR